MCNTKNKSGFALLFFVLVLLGLGGVVLTASIYKTKNLIAKNKKAHNIKVLNEAKQALLFYAFNYPNFNTQGPGHLPCPFNTETGYDNDLDGVDDGIRNLNICTSVGRFPYSIANMNFYEAKDADEEHLWYAVSDNFYNLAPGVNINSDTVGTITVYDQSGSMIYDGATDGIAAIIIAPGAAMARDNDGDGVFDYNQVRNTQADKNNPINYLDAYNVFDNSTFVNASNTQVDGFYLGPTFGDTTQEIVVNDQMVIVTKDEVIEMAEKAVLDQYKMALDDYRANVENPLFPGVNVYPWLFDYNTTDIRLFESAGAGVTNIGRIPSIFANYFTTDSSNAFNSELDLTVDKTVTLFDATNPINVTISLDITSAVASNVLFTSGAFGNTGLLSADATGELFDQFKYYWDDFASSDGWQLCEPPATNISDCDRNSAGNLAPGTGNNNRSKILKVGLRFDFTANVNFSMDYNPLPTRSFVAADALNHARIRATFLPADVNVLPVDIYFEQMDDFNVGDTVFNVDSTSSQNVLVNTDMGDITNQNFTNLRLGVRYFPELPTWAAPEPPPPLPPLPPQVIDGEGWHDSILMAVSSGYQPGAAGACAIGGTCLNVTDISEADEVISLLAIAGQLNIEDEDGNGFNNDLVGGINFSDVYDIFENENADLDNDFVSRAANDRILILREQ